MGLPKLWEGRVLIHMGQDFRKASNQHDGLWLLLEEIQTLMWAQASSGPAAGLAKVLTDNIQFWSCVMTITNQTPHDCWNYSIFQRGWKKVFHRDVKGSLTVNANTWLQSFPSRVAKPLIRFKGQLIFFPWVLWVQNNLQSTAWSNKSRSRCVPSVFFFQKFLISIKHEKTELTKDPNTFSQHKEQIVDEWNKMSLYLHTKRHQHTSMMEIAALILHLNMPARNLEVNFHTNNDNKGRFFTNVTWIN